MDGIKTVNKLINRLQELNNSKSTSYLGLTEDILNPDNSVDTNKVNWDYIDRVKDELSDQFNQHYKLKISQLPALFSRKTIQLSKELFKFYNCSLDLYEDSILYSCLYQDSSNSPWKGVEKLLETHLIYISKNSKVIEVKQYKEVKWMFCAWKSDIEYNEKCTPYFSKEFTNHNELKTFSGDHHAEVRMKYPDYVSDYTRYENLI